MGMCTTKAIVFSIENWPIGRNTSHKKSCALSGSKLVAIGYKIIWQTIIYIIWIMKNTFIFFGWWLLSLATDSFHAVGSSCESRGSHDGCDFITPYRRPVKDCAFVQSVEDIDHG